MSNNILYFDIETTAIKPQEGRILSIAFCDSDEMLCGVYNRFECQDCFFRNVKQRIDEAEYHAGWSSRRFDIGWLNYHLNLLGFDRLEDRGQHIDVQKVFASATGRSPFTTLDAAASYLGVQDEKHHKTAYDPVIWAAADAGDFEANQWILNHGMDDVMLTRRVYEALIG